MRLNTYVNYPGTCEEAFTFYEQHLGARITSLMRHGQQPVPGRVGPEWNGKVLHEHLALGGTELFGADVPNALPMRSVYLSLSVDTADEAERVYGLLSEKGEVFMGITETFFAQRFAMLRDRFGTSWMLLCPKPQGASRA